MAEPELPSLAVRDGLLAVTAELIARAGVERFVMDPVRPGAETFPDHWDRTRYGTWVLARRLALHAGLDRTIEIEDRRAGAPPTERKPATRVECVAVTADEARFALGFLGTDDVGGTIAHEIGVAFALQHRHEKDGPYRSQEPQILEPEGQDSERGSIATVYLGLGVIAANAAYQYYSWAGRFNGAYEPLEFQIVRATHVPVSSLAYLLAVQAVVRAPDGKPVAPAGLEPPQRDEVSAWIKALRGQRGELRARLGIAPEVAAMARPAPVPFTDLEPDDEVGQVERKNAFRWLTHRGGVGLIAGTVFGVSIAMFVASRGMLPWVALGGATGGHVLGRRVRVPRCSACAGVVPDDATLCPHCGALLRGEIASLSERLDAEEQLEAEPPAPDQHV
ncbi:MAG: zinc ribbon domain-containing protein [Kofleriaceae bacterium]